MLSTPGCFVGAIASSRGLTDIVAPEPSKQTQAHRLLQRIASPVRGLPLELRMVRLIAVVLAVLASVGTPSSALASTTHDLRGTWKYAALVLFPGVR